MTTFGLKLMVELRSARELIDEAVAAEERELGFVAISDHIHPWLSDHQHSPFAWSVLGAVADRTGSIGIATGLTCPIFRYHPTIVAQAAATIGELSGGRFTLAVGAGERLNEHVAGDAWPAVDVRHEMLGEAIDIMRALWTAEEGTFVTYRGRHLTAEDVRVYDRPELPVDLVVGVSGPASLDLAADHDADGIMATDPEPSLVDGWAQRGGDRSATWTEIPFAVADTAEEGLRLAHERFRFGAPGWKVMAELPNPVNFDAATASVRPEDLAGSIPHGPDPAPYIEATQQFIDAGFDKISFVPVGDDMDRFWDVVDKVRAELG